MSTLVQILLFSKSKAVLRNTMGHRHWDKHLRLFGTKLGLTLLGPHEKKVCHFPDGKIPPPDSSRQLFGVIILSNNFRKTEFLFPPRQIPLSNFFELIQVIRFSRYKATDHGLLWNWKRNDGRQLWHRLNHGEDPRLLPYSDGVLKIWGVAANYNE